ncbi:MAG: hypothetical protein AAGF13_03130 [Pseudomonadota bacterium]
MPDDSNHNIGAGGEENAEPAIIIVGIERTSYFLFKGDEHLDQLLLARGEFPTPVLCVHFSSKFEAMHITGSAISQASHWAVHPEIVERLRSKKQLVETDARGG